MVLGGLHPVEPGPQRLVVAHRHLLGKMRVGADRIEGMVLPEGRHASVPDELVKDPLLRPPRMPAPVPRLRRHQGSQRATEGGEEGHGGLFGCVGIAKLGNLGDGGRGGTGGSRVGGGGEVREFLGGGGGEWFIGHLRREIRLLCVCGLTDCA